MITNFPLRTGGPRVPGHFAQLMNIRPSVFGTIGSTPLVKLNRIAADVDATIALKCEFFNPLGSVKDRIGLAMVEAAERQGLLGPRTLIVEPSSGNTGIALAFIAAAVTAPVALEICAFGGVGGPP